MQGRTFFRTWRLCGMMIVLVMLIVALCLAVPWTLPQGDPKNRAWAFMARLTSTVSCLLLFFTYMWRLTYFFESSSRKIRKLCRDGSLLALEARIKNLRLKVTEERGSSKKYQLTIYIALYVWLVAIVEYWESFLASINMVAFNLLWATSIITNVRTTRFDSYDYCGSSGNLSWSFGQILAVAFLLLPLLHALDCFLSESMLSGF
jgi:hypothetical protein